tara:strand:- start:3572 stop:4600 length:1029 start_codon:yes stop_codon:yes gene_type:complete
MFDKALELASKYPDTFVFGGYVRDVMIGGLDESYVKDLDLFFQKERDVWSFIEIFSIFFNNLESNINRATKKNGYLNNDNDVISCVFINENKKFYIDCVFPNIYEIQINQQIKEPVSYRNADMDVNMFFLKLDGNKSQMQICSLPHNYNPASSTNNHNKRELFFIKTLGAIHQSRFNILNTPDQLALNNRQKTWPDINTVRGKAIKLLWRAEKMVSRGWTQENENAAGRKWYVVKFGNLEISCDKGSWLDVREIVLSETKCSICYVDYEKDHKILVGPCGHTCHVFCSDYSAEKGSEKGKREDTGFAGWIKTGITRSKELRSMNLPYAPTCMSCLMCKRSIF